MTTSLCDSKHKNSTQLIPNSCTWNYEYNNSWKFSDDGTLSEKQPPPQHTNIYIFTCVGLCKWRMEVEYEPIRFISIIACNNIFWCFNMHLRFSYLYFCAKYVFFFTFHYNMLSCRLSSTRSLKWIPQFYKLPFNLIDNFNLMLYVSFLESIFVNRLMML